MYEIQNTNKHFKHCVKNILFKVKHYSSLVLNSLESIHNEYIFIILHTALHIAGDVMSKEFSIKLKYEIIGNKCSEQVDYAIKEAKNLVCVIKNKV